MQLTTVLILFFVTRPFLARNIIDISKHNESFYLIQATMEVLTSCYGNQVNAVGLVGHSDGYLTKILQSSTFFSVTLLDSTMRITSHELVQRYKLPVFIITASSSMEIQEIIRAMKDSVWWNHMASIFILIKLPVAQNGCSKAFEMLSTAWKMDLLNTKLLCLKDTKEMLIYTYNPFMPIAPGCWVLENTYVRDDGHPWTLFVRKYQDYTEICEGLDFDKTRNLGGYGIRATVKSHPGHITIDYNKTGVDRLLETEGNIAKIMFHALNAIPKLHVYDLIGYDVNGRDILMDAVDGISDIMLNHRYTSVKDGARTTYPHYYSGLSILTQYSDHLSQLEKILSVVDSNSRRGICLVILITLLFFIFFLRQSLVPAMLNTFRIICNSSLLIVPTKLALRFYLGSLFIFTVTVLAIYQGKLASLLTKPVFLPNVNTIQDLVDGDFTVYAHKTVERYFGPSIYEGRFVELEIFSCVEYVQKDPAAACVSEYFWLIRRSEELRLHISRNIIIKLPISFVIRDDWPLESRVNKVLISMFEAHITEYEFMRELQKLLNARKYYEKQEENQQFKTIIFKELSFTFVILGIGLSCATICFMLEIGIKAVRCRISTVSRNI